MKNISELVRKELPPYDRPGFDMEARKKDLQSVTDDLEKLTAFILSLDDDGVTPHENK